MAIFGKCANCGATLIGGGKEDELRFCSGQCRNFHSHPGYCEQCQAETTADSLGGTFTINLVFGTRLMAWGSPVCPKCHSRVMRQWLWILIPLIPVSARHRVLYQTRTRYFSRKLKVA